MNKLLCFLLGMLVGHACTPGTSAGQTITSANLPIEVAVLATPPKESVRVRSIFRGFSIEEWAVQQTETFPRATFSGFSHFPDFATMTPRRPTMDVLSVLFSQEVMSTTIILREAGSAQLFMFPEPYNPYAEFRKDWDQDTKWLDLGDVVNRYTINKPDIRFQVSVHGSGARVGAIVPFSIFGKLLDR